MIGYVPLGGLNTGNSAGMRKPFTGYMSTHGNEASDKTEALRTS